MDRRELLKMIAMVTGTAVIGGEFFLTGCTSETKTEASFSATDISLLDEVGETILPATSSPGAKAAQVGEFMKLCVTDCYRQAEQDVFKKGIVELNDAAKKMHGKSFMDCTPEQRTALLLKLEEESISHNKALEKEEKPKWETAKNNNQDDKFVSAPRHYYTMMKQLTLLGYFTSKAGVTEGLRHVAVPGRYDGALPYKKGDKAFS